MAEIASAFVSLLPSLRGFGSKTEHELGPQMDGAGKRLGKRMGTGLKIGAGALLAGGAVAAGFLASTLDDARESIKVGKQTGAVIKSTGGAANVTAKQVSDLAGAISAKTGVDDEAVQSASNLLLTFTNVRNEVGKGNDIFNQATQAATDMGAAMGKDPKASAIQLGKALNDPVKGITALSKVGVAFTEQQKTQIKTMVASGNTVGAQRMILGELRKEFGGSAAAVGTNSDKFKVAFGNMKEAIGGALIPVIDKLMGKLTPLVISLTNNVGPAATKLGKVFGTVRTFVAGLFDSINGGGKGGGISTMLASFKAFASTVGANVLPVVKTLAGLFMTRVLPVLVQVGRSIATNFVPVLKVAANTFRTVVLPAVLALAGYLVRNLFPIFKTVAGIVSTQVVPIIASLARIIYGTVYPAVVKIATAIAVKLKPTFDQLFQSIRTQVLPAVRMLLGKLQEWMPTIRKVVSVVLRVVGVVLVFAAAIIGKVLPVVIKLAGFLIKVLVVAIIHLVENGARVVGFIIRFGRVLVGAIAFAVKFQLGVLRTVGKVLTFFGNLPTRISNGLGHLGGLLVNKGKDLVRGLWDGIRGAGSWLMHKITGFVRDHIPGPVAKALGIKSPSRVMAAQARWIPRGMAKGIDDNAHHVDNAMTRLSGRVQLAAPGMDAGALSPAGAGGGGQQIRGTLGIDRDGVAYIHGVSRGEVAGHAAAQQAADRAAAMSL